MPIRAVVTDIEGTTTSLAFVKEVLFPYASERLADFVDANKGRPEVRRWLEAAKREAGEAEMEDAEAVATLRRWIAEDRKATPLKALQGILWQAGYEQGDYTGHVHPDAVARLRQWHAEGVRLFVFSSGSVQAQQLLFRYSDAGDLTPLFSGYFDTTTGPKRDPAAYSAISLAIDVHPAETLFLSDIVEELDAARAAGLQTLRLARAGEYEPDPACLHPQVRDFSEIDLAAF